jgi:selenide,water dikinase
MSRDDAAVYRLSAERCLIATVDFFTPIVDDAASWGAIAAANALSDVYAMGGRPLFALNLVGWPRESLPFSLLGEALAGAARIMALAECPMVGGHSIDDLEPKLGMAVIGEAHPDSLLMNSAGNPGDILVLTKPLGTGILTTAAKTRQLSEADLVTAVQSMTTLNAGAMRAALAAGVRCATDVTGFGLLGHLGHIVSGSGVGAEISWGSLPLLPLALDLAERGIVPAGTIRNLEAAAVEWAGELTAAERILACDAQTSGGLLLAVAPEGLETLLAGLGRAQTPAAAVIGRLTDAPGSVRVLR